MIILRKSYSIVAEVIADESGKKFVKKIYKNVSNPNPDYAINSYRTSAGSGKAAQKVLTGR